jgi:hypothetical protein
MMNPQLKLFTDPIVLYHINRNLLAQFFAHFSDIVPKYSLPNPVLDSYPEVVAEVLQNLQPFTDAFVKALIAVEELAQLQTHVPLDPHTDFPDSVRLAEAIRLWLHPPTSQTLSTPIEPPEQRSPSPPLETVGERRPCQTAVAQELAPSSKSTLTSSNDAATPFSTNSLTVTLTKPPASGPPQARRPLATQIEPDHIAAPSDTLSDEDEFLRLATLSTAEYDRVRLREAIRLRLRVKTLDTEVAHCRAQLTTDAEANAIKLPVLELWPEPVNGAETLHEVSSRFSAQLVLCPGAPDALTLWTGHTHPIRAFYQTPRLNLHSPHGGCGKTTTLELLATMVPRPLSTENMKPAVLFRVVDQHQPTLLLDELDTYLHQANELRGLLNAGHKRGACAYRCEGAGNSIRAFNAFAAAALAGIGPLPATLRDRSILIPLVRAKPAQLKTRFDPYHAETETILGRKLARWARDNFDAIAACNPPLPPGAFNRLADNWRPLFAIAHVAGDDWPQRAAEAFAQLSPTPQTDSDPALLLLADIRSIFAASGAQSLFSSTLVDALVGIPARPWSRTSSNLAPIDQSWLARRLRPFDIRSHNLRIGTLQAKGYDLADFAESFSFYLDNPPVP